ncbi:MAG: 2-hydroxyacid dehydrogenase [Promethearchaeota archaeon]
MSPKVKVYLTTNVFIEDEIGSNDKISLKVRERIKFLWSQLNQLAEFKIFNGRFPKDEQFKSEIEGFKPDIIGCHLSHIIPSELLESSEIIAILTSTAGYNHIERTKEDNIIITHTPGVLHETVADYTVALILSNLRNIVDLHNYVWNGNWSSDDKWDLDRDLSSVITNKTLGIVGLGEIGSEIVKKLHPWGLKIIYNDTQRNMDFEMQYPLTEYRDTLEAIFSEADIISLHIPLNTSTEKLINRELLLCMKKGALLVNTARGGILNLEDLLDLIEKKEIQIHFSFDVFPDEPIPNKVLERFKRIKKDNSDIRMILMPHNASADADTRGKMVILFLEDLLKIIESSEIDDLNRVHLIPEHKKILYDKEWRIYNYWNNKLK